MENTKKIYHDKQSLIDAVQPEIPGVNSGELSYGQMRIWLSEKVTENSRVNHIINGFRILMELDMELLSRCINMVIAEQASLRTIFPEHEGKISYQEIDRFSYVPEVRQMCQTKATDKEEWLLEIRKELEQTSFHVNQLPLFRIVVCKTSSAEYYLFLVFHHIIADGISIQVFMQSVAKRYFSELTGEVIEDQSYNCTGYTKWQNDWIQKNKEKALAFWSKRLSDANFTLDINETGKKDAKRFDTQHELLSISTEENQKIRKLSERNRITPFTFYLSAYYILLYKYTGQHSLIIGVPVANRDSMEDQGVIGCYINMIPVHMKIDPADSILTFALKLSDEFADCLDYRHFPFDILAKTFAKGHSAMEHPIFQAMFVFQNFDEIMEGNAAVAVEPYPLIKTDSEYALTLELHDSQLQIDGFMQCQKTKCNTYTMKALAEHYIRIIKQMISNPFKTLNQIDLLTETDKLDMLKKRYVKRELPDDFVYDWIERAAYSYPNKIALVSENSQLTYKELNERSTQLCNYLIRHNICFEHAIGVYMFPSIEMIIAIVGILKAGAAYVPIDPSLPDKRVQYILRDSCTEFVIYGEGLHIPATESKITQFCLSLSNWPLAMESKEYVSVNNSKDNMCYIIYTSGTTGTPKGVVNIHKGLMNRLIWMKEKLHFKCEDVFIQKTPFTFDVSVWELLLPIMIGAKLVIIPVEKRRDTFYLMNAIFKNKVSVIHFVPSMLEQFVFTYDQLLCSSLRTVVCSGEALPYNLAVHFMDQCNAKLYNLYGPTEASIDVTYWECKKEDDLIPIGYPIDNTYVMVLDSTLKQVPFYVKGEICLSGTGLARGYINQPKLTREKFVTSPFDPATIIYRTGDWGYLRPDGSVVYLGRDDGQIKINGNRIELGEIESRAMSHPDVKSAKALIHQLTSGAKKIYLFIVSQEASVKEEVFASVKQFLPYYMVPTDVIQIDSLPITSNGKADLKKLNSMITETIQKSGNDQPNNETEALLLELWKKVLRTDAIGVNDNFFQKGGDSLLCIQFIAEARRRGLGLQVQQIYEAPTISLLSNKLLKTESIFFKDTLVDKLPLSPTQRWFLSGNPPHPSFYNNIMLFDVDKSVSFHRLADGLQRISAASDIFHYRYQQARFGWEAVASEDSPLNLQWKEVTNKEVLTDEIHKLVMEMQETYSLHRDAPLRCVYLKTAHTETADVLICIVHHFYIDGYSWNLFLGGLNLVLSNSNATLSKTIPYSQWLLKAQEHPLPPLREKTLKKYMNRLVSKKDGVIKDCQNGVRAYKDCAHLFFMLQPQIISKLSEYNKCCGLRMDTVLLNAFCKAVAETYSLPGVIVDMEGHGRTGVSVTDDLSETIGWFTTIVPLFISADADDIEVDQQMVFCSRYGRDYMKLVFGSNNDSNMYTSPKGAILFNYLGNMSSLETNTNLVGVSHINNYFLNRAADTPLTHCMEINIYLLDGELYMDCQYDKMIIESHKLNLILKRFENCLNDRTTESTEERKRHCQIGSRDWNTLKRKYPVSEMQAVCPLTPMQEVMLPYYITQRKKGGNSQVLTCNISPNISLDVLQKALETLTQRHPILRSTFIWRGLQKPAQIIYKAPPMECKRISLQEKTSECAAEIYHTLLEEWKSTVLDFTKPPLNRFYIVEFPEAPPKLVWQYLIGLFDNVSWENLVKDIEYLYHQLRNGNSFNTYAAFDFVDYVDKMAHVDKLAIQEFWQNELKGVNENDCRSFIGDKKNQTGKLKMQQCLLSFDPQMECKVENMCKRIGISVSTYYHYAWAVALCIYEKKDSVLYSILSYGRLNDFGNMDTVIGPCSNNLPMFLTMDNAITLDLCLRNLHIKLLQIQKYDMLSLYEIFQSSDLSMATLDVAIQERMFVFTSNSMNHSGDMDNMFSDFTNSLQMNVPMRLHVKQENGIQILLEYDADKIPQAIPQSLCRIYWNVIVNMYKAENITLRELRELCKTGE